MLVGTQLCNYAKISSMISSIQAIILGALQGITELFPVSSLGHSVILPKLLGWNGVDQHNALFLVFLVATHLATSLVLFGFFFKDWVLIIKGIFRSLAIRKIETTDTYAKLGWLIIVSSIPAGILGLLFEEKLKALFASPRAVAIFLILNGFMLYAAELLRKKSKTQLGGGSDVEIAKMTWLQAVKIGCAQCIALIPGFSRTGSTIGGGLTVGLDQESSARFSFLIATPIIFAASLLKLPELITPEARGAIYPILLGSLASALTAYFSIRFLTRYFQTKKLTPFAVYCIVAGALATLILFVR